MTQPEPNPSTSPVPIPEELAAEYLAELESGSEPSLQTYLERLPAGQHQNLRELVESARLASGVLPRQIVANTVLMDRFQVIEEIGHGGMGKVYRAYDKKLQRDVAIKVLGSLSIGDHEQEKMLLKESRLLAGLKHPNIVAIHETGRDGDLTFIVMELVEGVSLSEVIDRARSTLLRRVGAQNPNPREGKLLSEAIGLETPDGRPDLIERSWYPSVCRIALEIARTLEAAHAQNVIHRDLKPNNLMLLGGGNPVVLDFGLAGSLTASAGEVTQGLYGTVAYIAPEQAKSHQVGTDPRTDVYQLGLILYELLTLHRAFPGEGIADVLSNIRGGLFRAPRKLNPAIPRDLEAICLKAMELNPERRYPSAKELREDLERVFEGREAPHAARSNLPRAVLRNLRYLGRRHPGWSAAAGMVAVALLVGVLTGLVYGGKNRLEVAGSFKLDTRNEELTRITLKNNLVALNDALGVEVVNPEEEAYVYAISVFGGGGNDEKFVRPMIPQLLDDFLRDKAAPEGWGLRLEKGTHRVYCTSITSIEDYIDYEGLMVFPTSQADTVLAKWLDRMSYECDQDLENGAVHFEQAMQMLQEAAKPDRGSQGGRISAELRATYSRLADDLVGKPVNWEDDDIPPFKVDCRVVKP